MSSGLTNTIVAKETKAKLKRVDVFRNDKDCRIWKNPQPYPDAETWRKAMGEKLKYSATDLRTNLEVCLIAPRYELRFQSQPRSHHSCYVQGSEDLWRL